MISETNWTIDDDKKCIIRIEADDAMTRDDIEVQFKATLRGCGFFIDEMGETE